MAKQFIDYDVNPKGFLIIEATAEDFVFRCNFGINGNIVCDNCAHVPDNNEKCYYVAVLNRVLCRDCLESVLRVLPVRYTEDIPYEIRKYNIAAAELCIPMIEN